MPAKESANKKLEKQISYKPQSAWIKSPTADIEKFANEYKSFLGNCKTEREAARHFIAHLQNVGFQDIDKQKRLNSGDKVFRLFKNRVVLAAQIGKNKEELRIIGSHIDSPRLDLKPNPLYEEANFALLKSHYYGGIKKYHWLNTPLSLHAVVHTTKGKKEIIYGEKEEEGKFIIPDLLPHLAKEQMKKNASEMVTGEQLNVIIGHIPVDDEEIKKQVKFALLKLLNDKYGIVERDFLTADISLTPAQKPLDIGWDQALIAAYGQDDRVCAYTSFAAFLGVNSPAATSVAFFADKEEIGSCGDTGAQGRSLENFIHDLLLLSGVSTPLHRVLAQAKSISADVTSGVNPNFADVHDKSNASYLGMGVSLEKYGGGGGKYSTNDASSEYISWLVQILDKAGVKWQTGENGKIDLGGGGTIAKFMSQLGMDCIDMGPCLLAMHSINEISSKVDVYHTYLGYKAFFNS